MKILLVDDDPDILLIASYTLKKQGGHTIFEAIDGISALEQAKLHTPDLIILDYLLPDTTGIELLAQLRLLSNLEATKYIFASGKSEVGDVKSFIKAGALGVITKPFQPDDFSRRINALINT